MRRSIAVLALAVVAGLGGGKAEAQVLRGGLGGPSVFTGPGGPVTLTPGYGYAAGSVGYAPAASGAGVLPYSYYVLPPSQPARVYVGPEAFPFYGHPYGYIYDRWTWPYMSQGGNGLAKYYYPPLGF